jgi:hypothetical protein
MLTRKHFTAIADIISMSSGAYWGCEEAEKVQNVTLKTVSYIMADYFASENPNFDRARFLSACAHRE